MTATITTNLTIPTDDVNVFYPTSWLRDDDISYEAGGLLAHIAAVVAQHGQWTSDDPGTRDDEEGERLPEVIAELERGGYLVPTGADSFELVHPQRLGAFPTTG